MSHAGLTVKYYDPEDLALLRRRAERERRGQAHHGHGHAHAHAPVQEEQAAPEEPPVPAFAERGAPPAAYVQSLLGHEAPPYDPNVDAYSRGVDVNVEADTQARPIPVRGTPGAACSTKPGTEGASPPATQREPPRPADRSVPPGGSSIGSELTSLNVLELATWCVLVYLPARFDAWLGERQLLSAEKGGRR